MRAVGENTGMTISGLALFLSGLCASLVMSYAMTVAISYLAIVMLENFIVSSVGLILLGFGGSEYTRNYALSYVKTLFHIGFKLFLATVIIQIGVRAFRMATTGVGSADDDAIIQICMNLIAQSFFFMAIVKVIPQIADTLIAGVSMGISSGGAAIRSGFSGTG